MEKFSEKSLLSLGDYYVYGLIDPRNRKIFYIGKGTGNRIFEHELESQGNPESEKSKLKMIAEIKAAGLEVEKIYGAEELQESDIRHKIMIIKINKLYQKGMTEEALYDSVRGIWRASLERVKTVEYVFGVYNSLIVAVYKPTTWYVCKEALEKLPSHVTQLTSKTENRVFFIDEGFENHGLLDEAGKFYLYKSIAGLKVNQSAQNPITYLGIKE